MLLNKTTTFNFSKKEAPFLDPRLNLKDLPREPPRRAFTDKPLTNLSISTLLPSKNQLDDFTPDCEPEFNMNATQRLEPQRQQTVLINQIPSSTIGFKKIASPMSSSRHSKKANSYQHSTESSIKASSQTTPLSGIPRVLDFDSLSNRFENDMRPPSTRNNQSHIFSNKSSYFADNQSTFRSPEKTTSPIFRSAQTQALSEITASTPEMKLRIDTNNLSFVDAVNTPVNRNTNVHKSLYISDFRNDSAHTTSRNNTNRSPKKYHTVSGHKSRDNISPLKQSKTFFASPSRSSFKIFDEAQNWLKHTFTMSPKDNVKCNCDGYGSNQKTCNRALGWIYKRYRPHEFDYLRRTYEKIALDQRLTEAKHITQIDKDIRRTYPECPLFKDGSEGIRSLERLLNTFAKYDPNIGYVQGMNFIAASLLYHAEEYLAFWIMVTIFETLEMRDVFLPRLPGLSKHCQIIDVLILNFLPNIYSKLCEFGIQAEMYCSEWILTLFSGIAPIQDMGIIYDLIIEGGWPSFYKLILALMNNFKNQIEVQTDLGETLMLLKSQNNLANNSRKRATTSFWNWEALCKKTHEIEIDLNFVYEMHLKFDAKNLWFKTTL